jgi:transcriptional regulator with XRE-family HTH domain
MASSSGRYARPGTARSPADEAVRIRQLAPLTERDIARATGAGVSTVSAWLHRTCAPTGRRAERLVELSAIIDRLAAVLEIVRDHPEIDSHREDALRAVSTPDHVAPDPSFEARKRYYARGVGPSRWLLVVVSYEQTPARIVSVFANRKDPKSWSA